MPELRGKVALITGGGKGIGKSIAQRLAFQGLRVALLGRDASALQKTARSIQKKGGEALPVAADVTHPDQTKKALAEVLQKWHHLHILINNAGSLSLGSLPDLPLSTFRQLMEVNYFAAISTTQHALPYLQREPQAHILNITSIGARRVFPGYGAYNATKFALAAFTEGLRNDLYKTKVRVSMVHPVGVDTAMGAPLKETFLGRLLLIRPDTVARAVWEVLQTGAPERYVPRAAKALALLNLAFPSLSDPLARWLC